MHQIQADDLEGVSKTLLIPLHYRVQESRSGSSGFRDELGERFHDAITFDWGEFDADPAQGLKAAGITGVMNRRFAIFDEQVGNFLEKSPNGLVVNLGAGLDTRFHRLDNGRVQWIDLDLPGVIAFRRKLGEPVCARHRLVAASVLDDAWVAEIQRQAPGRILFVAEGLFMYFTEEEHRKLFTCLADHFPGQELLFHTIAPSLFQAFVQYRLSFASRLSLKAEMRWGLDDSRQVSALDPRVVFIREFPLLDGSDQLPEPIRQSLSPAMARQAMKIVQVRFRA
jgi:O-methyltransferase involved in polyketide biosynthesis